MKCRQPRNPIQQEVSKLLGDDWPRILDNHTKYIKHMYIEATLNNKETIRTTQQPRKHLSMSKQLLSKTIQINLSSSIQQLMPVLSVKPNKNSIGEREPR